MNSEGEKSVSRLFSWVAGFLIVGAFVMAVFIPDLWRGYVDASVEEVAVSSGQRVYETYCIGCHGADGTGNGEAAPFLNPKPRDFVTGAYKFFRFGEPGPLPTDDSLALTIRNGLPGSAMPAFPLLSDQEVVDVRSYIKSFLASGWTGDTTVGVGEVGVALKIEGTTGEELFLAAGCNACHQLDALDSVGGIGPNLSEVGGRLGVEEIATSIKDPGAVIAEECPAGPCPENVMPKNFAERLTSEQVELLAQFLSEQN